MSFEGVLHFQRGRISQPYLPRSGVPACNKTALIPKNGASSAGFHFLDTRFPNTGQIELNHFLLHSSHEDAMRAVVDVHAVHIRHVFAGVGEAGNSAPQLRP